MVWGGLGEEEEEGGEEEDEGLVFPMIFLLLVFWLTNSCLSVSLALSSGAKA